MGFLSFDIAKASAAFLTIPLTPIKDIDAPALVRRRLEAQEHINTSLDAINYLHRFMGRRRKYQRKMKDRVV